MLQPGLVVFDWSIYVCNEVLDNTICNVVATVEEIEFDVLGRRNPRSDRERHQFKAIISAYIANVFSRDKFAPSSHYEINFSSNPCPFVDAQDIAIEVLALLAHSDLNFLEVVAESEDEHGGRQIHFRATPDLLSFHSALTKLSWAEASSETTVELKGEEKTSAVRSDLDDTQAIDSRAPNPLDHSRPLDVHVWSDHPEVNSFVDRIYADYFRDGGNPRIRKAHIKVVLLDLYVAWTTDPTLKISYSRSPNEYEGKSRYNELHISRLTIEVVDRLIKAGLVEQAMGFNDRITGIGRQTRIWPTTKLINMFEDAKFGPLDVGDHADREVIVLRDIHKQDINYPESQDTARMRRIVRDYNRLIQRTFIDIPVLEHGYIELKSRSKCGCHRLLVNQRDKFTRRIFNRSSFEQGGRFYGGWWQRCPKEWRKHIRMNDQPVSEIDYSGLHIVLLYAQAGIDYWNDIGGDPYGLDCPDMLDNAISLRDMCKRLTLIAINAKSEAAAFRAFRDEAETGSPEKHMTDAELSLALDCLRQKHSPIASMFASDAGVDLMNQDAKITELIIEKFIGLNVPILTIHDSYLVPVGMETELQNTMKKAFRHITGVNNVGLKALYADEHLPPNRAFEPNHPSREATGQSSSKPTTRYLLQRQRFTEWLRRIDS